jgi:hypothetical protein
MILRYILWGLLIYFLYKFVSGFIIPIFRASRQFRNQVRDFHHKMQEENQQQEFSPNNNGKPNETTHSKVGEYIDYEEVK